MAAEIHKALCVDINTNNLIEFTYFYVNLSRVHVCFSNFSRVRMFCDEDRLELVPESTRSGVS